MYQEGNILYFTPFYFKNGNAAKPKYLVVLKNIDGKAVLITLPTRRDNIPEKDTIDSGCVELPNIGLNCFVIPPNQEITENGKMLDFPTHIYGHQLDTYEVSYLENIYQIEGCDYEIFGKMKPKMFKDLLECLKTSKSVKNKYLRILNN
jgi:hypothetical protein